ncbi:MAG: maleate cis-trans isomerase [Chloroflexota bacterium]
MYGSRGRIGLVTLATDTSVLPEYQRLMPEDVAVYPAPILLPRGEVTAAALDEMLQGDQLERAASLLRWSEVAAVVFACTSGSLIHGPGWDRRIAARIEAAAGVPAVATATAVLDALRAAGARSVAVATPYLDEINDAERRFLDAAGFAVTRIEGLQCGTDREIGRLGPEDAIRQCAAVDSPGADAVFISCTNWHCVEAIPVLEARLGKPVISSNLAGAWAALGLIGAGEPRDGFGSLLAGAAAKPAGAAGAAA